MIVPREHLDIEDNVEVELMTWEETGYSRESLAKISNLPINEIIPVPGIPVTRITLIENDFISSVLVDMVPLHSGILVIGSKSLKNFPKTEKIVNNILREMEPKLL